MTTTPRITTVPYRDGSVALTVTEHRPDGLATGARPVVLVLHGGAGPQSVDDLARRLADRWGARVLVPTHPGFAGTARDDAVGSIRDLAQLYAGLLADENDVTVVGSSIGGWVAAELAATAAGSGRVGRLVLLDAVGLAVEGHPVADFFALTFDELAELSYANPEGRRIDPDTLPPAARAAMDAGRAALRDYAGTAMVDPTLRGRLGAITVPTLVVWGEADRIVDPAVGRAYADAIAGARLVVLTGAGHLPQLETPDALVEVLDSFAPSRPTAG